MRIGAIRVNRFARIDSQKNPYFHNVRAIRVNRLKPAIRNVLAREPSPGTLKRFARISESMRANLRIDSRESGHLSSSLFTKTFRRKPTKRSWTQPQRSRAFWKSHFGPGSGRPIFIQRWYYEEICALSMRVRNPSPALGIKSCTHGSRNFIQCWG